MKRDKGGDRDAPKTLLTNHRFQGYSRPEIVAEWERACSDLGPGFNFQGRKLKPGPLLNALALYFMRKASPRQRAEIARWGLAELEAAMEGPETDAKAIARWRAKQEGRRVRISLGVKNVRGGKADAKGKAKDNGRGKSAAGASSGGEGE